MAVRNVEMSPEVIAGVELSMVRHLLTVCEAAVDNALECLNFHMESVVVNPQKHEAVANLYRQDISAANAAVVFLQDVMNKA